MAAGDRIPVNAAAPPWGQTVTLGGDELRHPEMHSNVQHPNIGHGQKAPATPWGAGRGNAFSGRARHTPAFSTAGGLHRGVRK